MINNIWSCLLLAGIFLSAFFGNIPLMTGAVMDGAKEAVNLCIIMAAVVGMWSGIMEIGVESGLLDLFAKKMDPFLNWLFPKIPKQSRAKEYIAANCAANILGLGWAATPAGIEAMKELEQWNPCEKGIASDEMCTFLVLNISSLQLLPVNLLAYRIQYGSSHPALIVGPAILATLVSTAAGIMFCKWKSGKKSLCTKKSNSSEEHWR